MLSRINNEKGVTQVIVVFALTAIIGAAALVIDVGAATARQIAFSNAVDAATLAGVMALPGDPDEAIGLAKEYIVRNGFKTTDISVTISDDNRSIRVEGNLPHNFYLAPFIGMDSTTLASSARAMIGPARSASGIRPLGIDNQDLTYGQQVTLKEGGGGGENGNFGAVAFAEIYGASAFKDNIMYGFNGEIEIGDIIHTEPGNMATAINTVKQLINQEAYASYENFEPDSVRVWVIPVLDSMDVEGRSAVTVIGFATFFIEDIVNKAGKAEITGRFIEFTTNGEIDESAPDIGVYAMKLIE